MPTTLPRRAKADLEQEEARRSSESLRALAIAGPPAALLACGVALPPDLALAFCAVGAVSAGFALEATRLLRGRKGAVRLRDYAAGLVFVGLAATILVDTDQTVVALKAFSEF
ncbi:MAG: hypothetical protein R3D44_12065 [Hyphomicrobiaceae bacterium]